MDLMSRLIAERATGGAREGGGHVSIATARRIINGHTGCVCLSQLTMMCTAHRRKAYKLLHAACVHACMLKVHAHAVTLGRSRCARARSSVDARYTHPVLQDDGHDHGATVLYCHAQMRSSSSQ